MMARSYEIKPRSAHLGGGWYLKMFQDGEEMGAGVYPLPELDEPFDDDELKITLDALHAEAMSDGESWKTGGSDAQ